MASDGVTIHLTPGEVHTGRWCDRCLTSAGYEVTVYQLTGDGPRVISTLRRCSTCDDRGR